MSWLSRGLESYRRIETDRQYGDCGSVPIARRPREQWLAPVSALVEAVQAAGHRYCPDMNAPDAWGVGPYPQNRRGTARMPTSVTTWHPPDRART